MSPLDPTFVLLIALVGALYASVGHGGASGYLAVLAFSVMPVKQASVLALVTNVFVASISFFAFQRAKHFEWRLAWPFLLGSVPFAFLGGSLKVSEKVYSVLLAVALAGAALRLLWREKEQAKEVCPPPIGLGVGVGAGIGLLSGMVGVGGGVFLSPIMVLAGWADAKKTSAVASLFIVANSLAGLTSRPSSAVAQALNYWPLILAGVTGAIAGSIVGANVVPAPWLRKTLGAVLMIAVAKLAFNP